MKDTTALILAAGLGMRMGPRGRLMPKGLIPLGGTPLVPQSVATLRARGFGRIVIVTGHLSEQYETAFAGSDVTLLHNPDYGSTGSLLTLKTGLAAVDGPCVILESDLIYAPQALDPICENESCLVTSGPTGAGDEVYIWPREGHVPPVLHDMSKDMRHIDRPHFGELVGITGLSAAAVDEMRDVARDILSTSPAAHYEEALVALSRRTAIPLARIDDLPWAEVDDEEMLARAERLVLPRVLAAREA